MTKKGKLHKDFLIVDRIAVKAAVDLLEKLLDWQVRGMKVIVQLKAKLSEVKKK